MTLVKENKKATTLSIGDGANDVGMIKGVCGVEWGARTVWGGVGGKDCVGWSGGQGLCGYHCHVHLSTLSYCSRIMML